MSRHRRRRAALPSTPAPHSPILFKSSQSFVDPRPMRIAPPRRRREDIGRRRDLQKHAPLKKGRQAKAIISYECSRYVLVHSRSCLTLCKSYIE